MVVDSVNTELEIALSDIVEASLSVELSDFGLGEISKFFKEMLGYRERYLMGLEVRVVLDDLKGFCFGVH